MEEDLKEKQYIGRKALIAIAIAVIFVFIAFCFYSAYFAHTVYPGVHIAKKSFTNSSYSDVYNFLEMQNKILDENGIAYKYKDDSIVVQPVITIIGDDITNQELIYFDNKKTAELAFNVGRSGNFLNKILERIRVLVYPKKIAWQYSINEEAYIQNLKDSFSKYEKAYRDPFITFDGEDVVVNDSISGNSFDYDEILKITKTKINNFDFSDIDLKLQETKSPVTKDKFESRLGDVGKVIDAKEFRFKYEDKSWKITNANYKNWLIIKADEKKKIQVTLDYDKFQTYFEKYISVDINKEVEDSRFKIEGGKVKEFQGSQDGKKVNTQKAYEGIEENIKNILDDKKVEDINLEVEVVKSSVSVSNINDLGIGEILGTGESDFKGSPKNRVVNIKAGARILNGILIPPGEEFATMKNLLPIDASNGFLQELVIKGNKTIPEYGGGLCQIGTTVFRAALKSGLNITERRNHSYRVSYYEPAGTDATIYDPKPDFRFINDTSNYILIQSRIVGTKVYFDFWGTKDGRKITVGKPVIYNIKKPSPMKTIYTNDLEPGKKKCTESAHDGADAYFDYTVEYIDGRETKKERYSSHYVPWQAVCLVGASATSTTGVSSSTMPVTPVQGVTSTKQ